MEKTPLKIWQSGPEHAAIFIPFCLPAVALYKYRVNIFPHMSLHNGNSIGMLIVIGIMTYFILLITIIVLIIKHYIKPVMIIYEEGIFLRDYNFYPWEQIKSYHLTTKQNGGNPIYKLVFNFGGTDITVPLWKLNKTPVQIIDSINRYSGNQLQFIGNLLR